MINAPFHIRILADRGISYDFVHDKWYQGKKEMSEDDVLVFLITCAKSERKYRSEAGVYAQKWLYLAKHDPSVCFSAFKKFRIRRNRNRRIAGKDLYAAFREEIGDPLSDNPDRRASELKTWCMHIARFYDALTDGGYSRCRTRARIAGKVLRSVFIGVELIDAKSERVRKEADEISENTECVPEIAETPKAKPKSAYDSFVDQLLGANRYQG